MNTPSSDRRPKNEYIDLKTNGRMFPWWILKNFKDFKLSEIVRVPGQDPCLQTTDNRLRKYQELLGYYSGPTSPYDSVLLYNGLGSGKTATAINLINIVYNYTPEVVFVILIKASLRDDPWMSELKKWLGRDENEAHIEKITLLKRFRAIHFVHYDAPNAEEHFLNVMKTVDGTKKLVFFIDESHNFIRNVYSNLNSKSGKRAQVIYNYMAREKRERKNTKIIMISATPIVNIPFETALAFNLLRPGIFPESEVEFNKIFITESAYPILNPLRKNLFSRRILGLVSHYTGATPDLYAEMHMHEVVLPMSDYQYHVYRVFEKIEAEIQKKAARYRKSSNLYRSYTRQACNFVFPAVSPNVAGELRPRPSAFNLNVKLEDKLLKGRDVGTDLTDKAILDLYVKTLENFLIETEKFFRKIATASKVSLADDIQAFRASGYDFAAFHAASGAKSDIYHEMYACSPKMTAIVFNCCLSPGKIMIYSNYVMMEGLDILKIYLRLAGFGDWTSASANMGYCEYHGRISQEERTRTKAMFNAKDNILGQKCRIILLSPSATEGIQLYNIRQEHILEPYWNEVRIRQVIGRGHRQCSHQDLEPDQRKMQVYRYLVAKPAKLDTDDTVRVSTDQYIQDRATARENLNESFLAAMREAAFDCELFRAHNMMSGHQYSCFQFPETHTTKNIGAAYKEDIKDDMKYDSGLGAKNSILETIRVMKIRAVILMGQKDNQPVYSDALDYWYYPKSGMVYDYTTHEPVGRVATTNDIPDKLNKDTYIMTDYLDIPTFNIPLNQVNTLRSNLASTTPTLKTK